MNPTMARERRTRASTLISRRAVFSACAILAARLLTAAPPPPTGAINITSEPPDAQVYLNMELRGTTPLSIEGLAAGPYLVTLRKPGFDEFNATVELEDSMRYPVQASLVATRALLLVHSTPPGADVEIDNAAFGKTPLLVTSLRLGTHRVRLLAQGFQPKEVEVELPDRAPRKISLDLASDSGTLDVSCDPDGASVFLDGIRRGAAPCRIERITGGDHELEVRMDGYVAAKQTIRLSAGETQAMQIELAPQPAALQVVSIPEGARAYVNNQFRGETPQSLLDLPPGEYKVRVEKEGHDPMSRTVTLGRGERKVEEFRLSSNTGRLEITTEPADVTVLVNGRKAGVTAAKQGETTNVSSPFPIEALPVGECELRFVRKGYFEKTQKQAIERGKTATLHVALERRFIPDHEIKTRNGVYRGVLDSTTVEGVRLETRPGIITVIPLKDILERRILREEEEE